MCGDYTWQCVEGKLLPSESRKRDEEDSRNKPYSFRAHTQLPSSSLLASAPLPPNSPLATQLNGFMMQSPLRAPPLNGSTDAQGGLAKSV